MAILLLQLALDGALKDQAKEEPAGCPEKG
ncbi:hypothetical protein MJC1_02292 [Methylocystis sp. MJC1]|jgi:hypothetical protein|nr:hypothetical protein MJC1_02292 [Methylocystis sp. MJC1]